MSDIDLDAVLRRVKESVGAKTETEAVKALGIKGNPSNWKARNTVPWELVFRCYKETGVTMEYLLTGEDVVYTRAEFYRAMDYILDSAISSEQIVKGENLSAANLKRLCDEIYDSAVKKGNQEENVSFSKVLTRS